MAKKFKPTDAQNVVKTVLTKLIKNISIIAIGFVLLLVFLSYAGIELASLETILKWKGTIPSIILMISNIILYELWLKNGQESARGEEHYVNETSLYETQSKNLNNSTMQKFIEWEYERRKATEQHKINREIDNLKEILKRPNLSAKEKKKVNKRIVKLENHIVKVNMPYQNAEEFDKLRYSMLDMNPKEYKPGDTSKALAKNRVRKYMFTITGSLVSFNILTIAFTGNWVGAIIMTLIAVAILAISIVSGFSSGYRSIAITDYGVYHTANEFINKANAWCAERQESLYYVEPEFKFSVRALDEIDEDYYVPTIEEAFPEPKGAFELNQKREIIIE